MIVSILSNRIIITVGILTICTATGFAAPLPSLSSYNLIWTTPSKEPGTSEDGKTTFIGAMPLGNGDLTALFGGWNTTDPTSGGTYMKKGIRNTGFGFFHQLI